MPGTTIDRKERVMSVERRLAELGITLPSIAEPPANFVNYVQTGNLLFLAGKGPLHVEGKRLLGKVGRELTLDQGYQAARSAGIALIATMKQALGELEQVSRIVKVFGMVNATPEFTDQPKVINGCSDLFVEVFGDNGHHARVAVGVGSLPNGIPVEIEAIVEIAIRPKRRVAKR